MDTWIKNFKQMFFRNEALEKLNIILNLSKKFGYSIFNVKYIFNVRYTDGSLLKVRITEDYFIIYYDYDLRWLYHKNFSEYHKDAQNKIDLINCFTKKMETNFENGLIISDCERKLVHM